MDVQFFRVTRELWKTIGEIFGGICAVPRDGKTAATRTEFRESFRISAEKRRNSRTGKPANLHRHDSPLVRYG